LRASLPRNFAEPPDEPGARTFFLNNVEKYLDTQLMEMYH